MLGWWVRTAAFVLTSAFGGVDKQKICLLSCCSSVPNDHIYLQKNILIFLPLDFIRTYLVLKFPIHCFLNKNPSSAEVFYMLWSRFKQRFPSSQPGAGTGVAGGSGRQWLCAAAWLSSAVSALAFLPV